MIRGFVLTGSIHQYFFDYGYEFKSLVDSTTVKTVNAVSEIFLIHFLKVEKDVLNWQADKPNFCIAFEIFKIWAYSEVFFKLLIFHI